MLTKETLKQLGTQYPQQKELIEFAKTDDPSAQQCAQQLRTTLSSL